MKIITYTLGPYAFSTFPERVIVKHIANIAKELRRTHHLN